MKRLLLFFIIVIGFVFEGHSQELTKTANPYGLIYNRISIDSAFYLPTSCGAPSDTSFLFSFGINNQGERLAKGALYYDSCGHHLYIWDPSLLAWHAVDTASGGGGADSSLYWTVYRADTASANYYNQLAGKQSAITIGTNAQYINGTLGLTTFPTVLSYFTDDVGYIDSVKVSGAVTGNGVSLPLHLLGDTSSSGSGYYGKVAGTWGLYTLPTGTGTVTSVVSGIGLVTNTITSSGTVNVDTTKMATINYVTTHIPSGALTQIFGKAPIHISGTDTVYADTSTANVGLTTLYQAGLKVKYSDSTTKYLTPYQFLSTYDSSLIGGNGILKTLSGLNITLKLDTTVAATQYDLNNTFDTVHVYQYGTSGIGLLRASNDTIKSKPIVAGTNITLTQNSDSSVTISSSGGGGTDSAIVGGSGIVKSVSGTTITLKGDTSLLATRALLYKVADSLPTGGTSDTATTSANGLESLHDKILLSHTLTIRNDDSTGTDSLGYNPLPGTDTTVLKGLLGKSGIISYQGPRVNYLSADTSLLATKAAMYKALDSLPTGGSDSATLAGYGTLKSTSGTANTIYADTSILLNKAGTQTITGTKTFGQINVSGSIIPTTVNTSNLGSSTYPFYAEYIYALRSEGSDLSLQPPGSGNFAIALGGAVKYNTSITSAGTYTILSNDLTVIFTGSTATWTFPSAYTQRVLYLVNHGTGAVTLGTAVTTANGTTTTSLAAGTSLQIIYDATNSVWREMGSAGIGGGGIDSGTVVTNGILKSVSGTTITLQADTSVLATQADLSSYLSLASGTYSPTFTPVSNCSSVSLGKAHYLRVGQEVFVSVTLTISVATNNSQSHLEMTLPISSTFTSNGDATGHGVFGQTTGSPAGTNGVQVYGDDSGGNPPIDIFWYNTLGTSISGIPLTFSYQYTIK